MGTRRLTRRLVSIAGQRVGGTRFSYTPEYNSQKDDERKRSYIGGSPIPGSRCTAPEQKEKDQRPRELHQAPDLGRKIEEP